MKSRASSFQIQNRVLKASESQPLINLRPFLFTALGLIFGILLYTRIRFGAVRASDFLFFILILFISVRPASYKRLAAIFLCFFLFAGAGAGFAHLYCRSFTGGMPSGEYEVTGTVVSFTADDENASYVLDNLRFDGERTGGKMHLTLSAQEAYPGDVITFRAAVRTNDLPDGTFYSENLFVKDVRYLAGTDGEISVVGRGNALLRLNAAVYKVFHTHLNKMQADTAYALLTGNTGSMDESFTTAIRQGGVAHIFAVSGLHIGILYATVSLLFCKLKGFRILPATAMAILYSAFCGFTVSSVRAVVMCTVMGACDALGRKYDFLSAVSFTCTLVLLLRPAEWLSAGFRLSFGACMGLALFTRPLQRIFKRLPPILSNYLSASLAVQLFTLPVAIETFGYFSIWGTILNFFLIPVLPVLFLGLFLCVMLALAIAPAAAVFLTVPNGMLSLFSYLFSFDFSLVLAGFSLGVSGTVYLIGAVLLSERVNFSGRAKLLCACLSTSLFTLCLLLENVVFTGCKLTAAKGAVLIETDKEHLLVIDGTRKTESYEDFLLRHYGGKLDAIIVLSDNENKAMNIALYLPKREIRALNGSGAALTETVLRAGKSFTYGALTFRYENPNKLTLIAENRLVEIDFTGDETLHADLFVSGKEEGVYYLNTGSVYALM